jgi:hypothetical protein
MATTATVTTEPRLGRELRGGRVSILRYSGFDQRDDTRNYVFQYSVPGEKAKPIVVSAEISLLVKHRVRIQDGPDLCLHTLMLEIQGVDFSQTGAPRRVLTAEDLLAYLASRPVPAAKGKRGKRTHEASGQPQ